MIRRESIPDTLAAFSRWLAKNPVDGDRPYSNSGVRYHVARYCEYLAANPWLDGDPLNSEHGRDGAVSAYRSYLEVFHTPEEAIQLVLASLDRFYVFLRLGPVRSPSSVART